jgi:hypothetical protein
MKKVSYCVCRAKPQCAWFKKSVSFYFFPLGIRRSSNLPRKKKKKEHIKGKDMIIVSPSMSINTMSKTAPSAQKAPEWNSRKHEVGTKQPAKGPVNSSTSPLSKLDKHPAGQRWERQHSSNPARRVQVPPIHPLWFSFSQIRKLLCLIQGTY